MEQTKKDRPAYLTITSLELPDSPIPLIESQASARLRSAGSTGACPEKDHVLDEFLESVAKARNERRKTPKTTEDCIAKTIQKTRKQYINSSRNNSTFHSIENCKKNIIINGGRHAEVFENQNETKDCICSEITDNLRINIREKTEVKQSSRSPSPEITHTIRIAMKYLGQPGLIHQDNPNTTSTDDPDDSDELISISNNNNNNNSTDNKLNDNYNNLLKNNSSCTGVNVALDFTLNCNSLQLTSRDISLKAITKNSSNTTDTFSDIIPENT